MADQDLGEEGERISNQRWGKLGKAERLRCSLVCAEERSELEEIIVEDIEIEAKAYDGSFPSISVRRSRCEVLRQETSSL